ncbi:MAG: hypothetical protein AB7V62_02285 [Thermoleophilia bacterium]
MPRRPGAARAAGLVAGVLVAAGLASGCVGLRAVSGNQPVPLGEARVSATVCAAQTTGCNGRGNSDTAPGENAQGQILLGFRIPAAATPPAAPVAKGVAFAADATYAAELQRLLPAPAGTRWVGYASATITYVPAQAAAGLPLTADFGLPVTPGAPFASPFRHRPVVGARSVTAGAPATRPVTCGPTPTASFEDVGGAYTVCVDWPAPGALATDLQVGVQDVALAPDAGEFTVDAGAVSAVPFTVRHAGPGTPPTLALAASTTLPGAAAAPSPATVAPTPGGAHQALVVLGIPAGTAPGAYDLTLRATATGGRIREATARVVVRAPAVAAPAPAPAARPRALRLDWRKDRRARFYNLQVFSSSRKLVSVFPRNDRRVVRLRPGRYRVVVWSGLAGRPKVRYRPKPWVNRTIRVRAAPTRAAALRILRVPVR